MSIAYVYVAVCYSWTTTARGRASASAAARSAGSTRSSGASPCMSCSSASRPRPLILQNKVPNTTHTQFTPQHMRKEANKSKNVNGQAHTCLRLSEKCAQQQHKKANEKRETHEIINFTEKKRDGARRRRGFPMNKRHPLWRSLVYACSSAERSCTCTHAQNISIKWVSRHLINERHRDHHSHEAGHGRREAEGRRDRRALGRTAAALAGRAHIAGGRG